MDDLFVGCFSALIGAILALTVALIFKHAELDACAEKHNVHQCEFVAVPEASAKAMRAMDAMRELSQ